MPMCRLVVVLLWCATLAAGLLAPRRALVSPARGLGASPLAVASPAAAAQQQGGGAADPPFDFDSWCSMLTEEQGRIVAALEGFEAGGGLRARARRAARDPWRGWRRPTTFRRDAWEVRTTERRTRVTPR